MDRIRQMGQELQNSLRESAKQARGERDDDMHLSGFQAAYRINSRRLDESIDALKAKLTAGELSKMEQVVLSRLEQLRSELEADFDYYWQAADVDWRPAKPVAKVVRKLTGEAQ